MGELKEIRRRRRTALAQGGGRGPRDRGGNAGFTVVELLVAGVILVVGFMGLMLLIATAIATNNRNKMDSSGTMLAGTVLEQIHATLLGTQSSTVTDCSQTVHTIETGSGPPPGLGAQLDGANIDFTQPPNPATGYQMDFVVGGGGSGLCAGPMKVTYDVRWNLQTLPGDATYADGAYLVTVSVKPKGAVATGNSGRVAGGKFFALPTTLRAYIVPCKNWGDCS